MAVKKEDWNFLKRNIYQNKQGKSKGIPKETTVLLVKNLTSYMAKMAESESDELDLASRVLPVCFIKLFKVTGEQRTESESDNFYLQIEHV